MTIANIQYELWLSGITSVLSTLHALLTNSDAAELQHSRYRGKQSRQNHVQGCGGGVRSAGLQQLWAQDDPALAGPQRTSAHCPSSSAAWQPNLASAALQPDSTAVCQWHACGRAIGRRQQAKQSSAADWRRLSSPVLQPSGHSKMGQCRAAARQHAVGSPGTAPQCSADRNR